MRRRPLKLASTEDPVRTDAARPAKAVGAPAEEPRVLIYDPEGLIVAARLRRGSGGPLVTIGTCRDICGTLTGDEIDVVLIKLSTDRFDGLAFGAEMATRIPHVEAVFWFDELRTSPVAEAARSLGIFRLLPFVCLVGWLDGALVPLARMARASRQHRAAAASLPPLPAPVEGTISLPLPEAERRFRETYVRRILSQTANQSDAARLAGLPYTTFRSILQKLGLG